MLEPKLSVPRLEESVLEMCGPYVEFRTRYESFGEVAYYVFVSTESGKTVVVESGEVCRIQTISISFATNKYVREVRALRYNNIERYILLINCPV
jgi:hypothetical protein